MSKWKAKTEIIKPNNNSANGQRKFLDFSANTIQQLFDELNNTINSPTPQFLWTKDRLNNKIKLDNEKQVLIFQKIQNLRAVSEEFVRLRADAIFTSEFIENINSEKRLLAEQSYEIAVANHSYLLTSIKSDVDITNAKIEHDRIDRMIKFKQGNSIDADNEIKLAQAEKIRAEADNIKSQNDLKRLVMSKINFDNFPPVYIPYLLSVLSGVNFDTLTNLDIMEKLKDSLVNMEEIKVKKAQAEVDDFINSAEYRKWKNEQARKDGTVPS